MMYGKRQNVSPLTIVLPHPILPRRRSSRLSVGSCSSPHTPRSCASPSCSSFYFTAGNRKSSDSWNSSIHEGDDLESEWMPEQILLLQRTLDALPSHLVTPYNGSIPPPNLIEKIARGISEAKGAEGWLHSIRATRVKIIELARQRATESAYVDKHRRIVTDENDELACFPDGEDDSRKKPSNYRRPLYRQSSMDFIAESATCHNDEAISQLSSRMQRTGRVIPNPNYHPYSRTRSSTSRRSTSPPHTVNVPSLISPSTPSSSTLNSLASSSVPLVRPRALYRSASSFSSFSSDSMKSSNRNSGLSADGERPILLPSAISAPDPRIQRVRRSESFYILPSQLKESVPFMAATPPPVKQAFKRAPSYGALAQEAKSRGEAMVVDKTNPNNSAYPSSDEEEKVRDTQVKKPRVKTTSPTSTPRNKTLPPLPSSDPTPRRKSKRQSPVTTDRDVRGDSVAVSPSRSRQRDGSSQSKFPSKPRMNLQRNPSIFGEELPRTHVSSAVDVTASPSPKTKTLRRVKRLPPSRKIEFGTMFGSDANDADAEPDNDESIQFQNALASAFQLR